MKQNEFNFYELPNILGNLGERLASVGSKIDEIKSNLNVTKESSHVLMSVQEACEYLKMPLSTFYFKVKNDGLPTIKQGKHLLIYRDELDKWLELSRKNPVPLTAEEENEKNLGIVSSQSKTLKLVALW